MYGSIIRLPQVVAITGTPKSTLYKWIGKGLFPKPVVLGVRSVGWLASDVDSWLQSRQCR